MNIFPLKTAVFCVLFGLTAAYFGTQNSSPGWGKPELVKKFSGGKLVYVGITTGKIKDSGQAGGYYFSDACNSGAFTEVAGDTVVVRPEVAPTCESIKLLLLVTNAESDALVSASKSN